jgi:hypothetical protein
MTNLEIDRRLALAIGYPPEDLMEARSSLLIRHDGWWQRFNHQHCRTIYPIAEHFKMMPVWSILRREWQVAIPDPRVALAQYQMHTDPRTCIALAVIEAADRGLLK